MESSTTTAKPVLCVLCIFLLALVPLPKTVSSEWRSGDGISNDPYFVPKDMALCDDGFGDGLFLHVETWYYEALFSNNWSAVFIVTVLAGGSGDRGLALVGLYFYEHGILIATERFATRSFMLSSLGPDCTINNQQVVTADTTSEGKLQYKIAIQVNDYRLELIMINQTKGWQGDMGLGWWLAVPRLAVQGNLTVDGEDIKVTGTGYHDHNRFAIATPLIEYGYMDGKMAGNGFSLVWGDIMQTPSRTNSFAIYSEGGNYRAVYPPALNLTFDGYIYDKGQYIPTICRLQFSDDLLAMSVNMTAIAQHNIRLPGMSYWRYHVNVEGHIYSSLQELIVTERGMMERMQY